MPVYSTARRRKLEPCNVCHKPVDTSKPCVYFNARCLDCGWQSKFIYVFCSEACAHKWTPPENPPDMPKHGCRAAGKA